MREEGMRELVEEDDFVEEEMFATQKKTKHIKPRKVVVKVKRDKISL